MDVRSSQATGNAAMHYVAWQLSKRGWNVMPTTRNAKGSDLYCANDAETVIFGVQSKGLSKRDPVGLGTKLGNLRSDWWIITINAKTDTPTCFILRRQEVVDLCSQSDPERVATECRHTGSNRRPTISHNSGMLGTGFPHLLARRVSRSPIGRSVRIASSQTSS